ncbi:MAG: nucleotidyltransferase family protein [Burkholderiales bacterium]|nr:nucleotidyltransferase family protein [Burkholderiales bacterium]
MENLEFEDLERRRERLLALATRHGAVRLRVFGSVALGEATRASDIDFLVEMEPGRSLLDLGALQMDLSDELNRSVDVVSEAGLRPPHRERILAEARPL